MGFSFVLDGTEIKKYIFNKPDISFKIDNPVNAFLIDPASLRLILKKTSVIKNLLSAENDLIIKKDNTIIWTGFLDTDSIRYNEKEEIYDVRFLPDVVYLKRTFGLPNQASPIHPEDVLDYIVSKNPKVDSYDASQILDSQGRVSQICSLILDVPQELNPGNGAEFENWPSPFLSEDGSNIIHDIYEKDPTTSQLYKQPYNGYSEVDVPYLLQGNETVINAGNVNIPFFGTQIGGTGRSYGHSGDWKLFTYLFRDRKTVWSYGEHWLLVDIDINNSENYSHADFVVDLCFFSDASANLLNGNLKFYKNETDEQFNGKPYVHIHARRYFEYDYNLRMQPSDASGIKDKYEKLVKYYQVKYGKGSFKTHELIIPDENQFYQPGNNFYLNSNNLGVIVEVSYLTKYRAIKIRTIEGLY